MSPAQAVVPVERYIGSCLISSVGYKKDRFRYPCLPEFYQPPNWGVPLVPPTRRPKKDKEERSPLSRLAIHTQGAPLIQAQRQTTRKNQKPPSKPTPTPQQTTQEESPNENSLPRIIKPRKRRKKDRKPQPAAQESTIVTLKPYTPLCQEFSEEEAAAKAAAKKPEEPPPQPQQQVEPHCCCRYCDPAGSVWDSPLMSNRDVSEWSTLQVSSEIITSPNGHRDIEIKFFSSPPRVEPPVSRPVSVTPPWQ